MTLHNANLKKRIMATMVTGVMATGAVVSAPLANAANENTPSQHIVNAYEKLSGADLARFDKAMNEIPGAKNGEDWSIDLLRSSGGSGFCIDWGLGNPWDGGNYEPRKLTGASGRVGDGDAISEDVRIAAINVVRELQKDYKDYAAGTTSKAEDIKFKNEVLRALLSNQLGHLNEARRQFKDHILSMERFTTLTGFEVGHYTKVENGVPNYYLKKVEKQHDEIAKTVKPGEYVTVLVPEEYDFNLEDGKSHQRLIPIPQPGLDPKPEPKPEPEPSEGSSTPETTEPFVTTVTSTLPAVTTTIERPKEVTTTQILSLIHI